MNICELSSYAWKIACIDVIKFLQLDSALVGRLRILKIEIVILALCLQLGFKNIFHLLHATLDATLDRILGRLLMISCLVHLN